jgi:Sec-independent protein translocase protein TatA
MPISIPELLIIVAVGLLVTGGRVLPKLARSIGEARKAIKESAKG